MDYLELYAKYFLNGLLGVLFLVIVARLTKRSQKVICVTTALMSYALSFFLFFFHKHSGGMVGNFTVHLTGYKIYYFFEYAISYNTLLFVMFSILFLVIISVEFGTMPPKNEEIVELELKERVKRKISKRLSKLMTIFFLSAQCCLLHVTFWFHF